MEGIIIKEFEEAEHAMDRFINKVQESSPEYFIAVVKTEDGELSFFKFGLNARETVGTLDILKDQVSEMYRGGMLS